MDSRVMIDHDRQISLPQSLVRNVVSQADLLKRFELQCAVPLSGYKVINLVIPEREDTLLVYRAQ
jgi:hypothetical protein